MIFSFYIEYIGDEMFDKKEVQMMDVETLKEKVSLAEIELKRRALLYKIFKN